MQSKPHIKDALEYKGLVVSIVGQIMLKLPSSVSFDELMSAGWLGLFDAIEKFDYRKGIKFTAYAPSRIRGVILDKLRHIDPMPRSTRQWTKKIEEATRKIEYKKTEPARDYEIADELKITLDKYDKILSQIYNSEILSLDTYIDFNENHDPLNAKTFHGIHSGYHPDMIDEIYKKELYLILYRTINKTLSKREKNVIRLYYYEDFTLKEIGCKLDLTESRICQIHWEAIKKLRKKMILMEVFSHENKK